MLKAKSYLLCASLILTIAIIGSAQTPSAIPEGTETVVTEEIKLNVAAFDHHGRFSADLQKEDLVIIEDDRLQQASSVRRLPASVLIALDTGGVMRMNLSVTRRAAKNLVGALASNDYIALLQYGDKVEMLADWTTDKIQLSEALDKKLSFGRRSIFNQSLDEAVRFITQTKRENCHLIFITDGADDLNKEKEREAAARDLIASGVNVHIISYTQLRQSSAKSQTAIFNEGESRPKRLPEEVVDTLPDPKRPGEKKEVTPRDLARMPRLGSITLDRERVRRGKENVRQIEADEKFLASIAEDTGGAVFLPESADDIDETTATLAANIDSQYVVTYVPKRPLKDAPVGEIRQIEVSARRAGVRAQARRKFIKK